MELNLAKLLHEKRTQMECVSKDICFGNYLERVIYGEFVLNPLKEVDLKSVLVAFKHFYFHIIDQEQSHYQ